MTATCPTCGQELPENRELLIVAIPALARKKPGRKKIEGPRPWDLAGISRRTYYRISPAEFRRRLKLKRRENATP